MLNEYCCWLQERNVTPFINVPQIVFAQEGGEVASQAAKEFANGINRLLGFFPKSHNCPPWPLQSLEPDMAVENLSSGTHLGMMEFCNFLNVKPENDGFYIKVNEKSIFIAGQNENGLLYGVFRFLNLLALGQLKTGFELCESPVSPLRMINHWDNFDGTVERGYAGGSLFYKDGRFNYDKKRIEDYARLLASTGINFISINNVNVRGNAKLLVTEEYLKDAADLACVFRRFGIKIFISINFASPFSLGQLPSADPLDENTAKWWKERASLIYKYIPDLAGFLVKADSEGEPGPFQYNRTHSDGANMLAKAVKPFGGIVIWRCFVYNCTQDWRDLKTDRARAAFDHFMPQDGEFDDNVILQIKFGPYDFQVREPVTPLFGALKKTRHVMELQITQEYTGHQIDLCYLPWMWEDVLNFDTIDNAEDAKGNLKSSRIKDLVKPYMEGCSNIEGFASVVNVGLDNNWTGHTLAQANLYGYGRIAWNPYVTKEEIAHEWSVLSFGQTEAAEKIAGILLKSYPVYEKYNAPFGVCFMVTPGLHYGPNIEGYEYSRWGTYHRADAHAIGIDRTPSGTGYTDQYSKINADLFADPDTCPENMILFFHRLRYDYKMKNGKTLLENIYDTHFEGYDEAALMLEEWKSLKNDLKNEVYKSVLSRFERQLSNAREWRDQINTYFFRKTGIPDKKCRKIYF